MGQIPSTENKAAKTTDQIIHFAIYEVAINAAETAIITQVPFLGLPIIKPITHALLNYIGGFFYEALARFTVVTIIDIQTAAERAAYIRAEGALRAAQLSGDKNVIDNATIEFKKALGSLIHFDGSYTPRK
jgi:hypothetical protein